MSWAKFDDGYPENRKVSPVSAYATLLHMFAILRCARLESDGYLTKTDMEVVLAMTKIPSEVRDATLAEAISAGLIVDRVHRFEVHDYLDYNPSHAELEHKRATGATRVQNWRKNGRRNSVSNGVTGGVTNGVSTRRPDPLLSLRDLSQEKREDPDTNGVGNGVTHKSANDWLMYFQAKYFVAHGRQYGQGEGDAKATGKLADLLDSLPLDQRSVDWDARERMVTEFLCRTDPRTVATGWSFSFFVQDFRGLAMPRSNRPPETDRFTGKPKKMQARY